MIKTTLSHIAKQLGCKMPSQDTSIQGICTDTRTIKPNCLFVAIQGENFDGNDFVADAFKKGAAAALVSRPIDCAIPQLIVDDTLLALGKISANWRNQFIFPIVGVTGSNGKTTLKNMIASILSAQNGTQVLATEGNLNNNIGLPLMLARLNATHDFAVLEMGMNHFGEISYLTSLTKPFVAVITNAAEAHLEGVGSVAGVAKAKGEIFEGLQPNGIAVLNRDDAYFEYWKNLVGSHRYLTFGLKNTADITATIQDSHITLKTPQGQVKVALSLLGQHNVMNALAATACALALNIDLATIKKGLENVKPASGRMRQYLLANGARIIDDTYNANPFSTQAAIHTLAQFSGKKILVLADMKELGENAREMHFITGQRAKQAGIDHLLTFGNLTEATCEGYGTNALHFTDRDKLLAALQPLIQKNAIILIKGSRSMKMEYFVEKLVPSEKLEHHH